MSGDADSSDGDVSALASRLFLFSMHVSVPCVCPLSPLNSLVQTIYAVQHVPSN